jgi:hypothetical protein
MGPECRPVANVAVGEVDWLEEDILVNEAVENPDRMSSSNQPIGNTAADVSCSSYYENFGHTAILMGIFSALSTSRMEAGPPPVPRIVTLIIGDEPARAKPFDKRTAREKRSS